MTPQDERCGILSAGGITMPLRRELGLLPLDPAEMRRIVHAAVKAGRSEHEIGGLLRDAAVGHDPTQAIQGPPDGEVPALGTDQADTPDPDLRGVAVGEVRGEGKMERRTSKSKTVRKDVKPMGVVQRKAEVPGLRIARDEVALDQKPNRPSRGRPAKTKSKPPPEAGSPAVNGDRLLKPPEAAAVLAIGPRKLWELTNARRIPCVRIDRSVRYRRSDLVQWIEEHREGSIAS